MIYQIQIPNFPLSQFVESFVYLKMNVQGFSLERFLPDGNINLVIDLTDSPKCIYDNDSLREIQTCKDIWFSGIRSNFITIPGSANNEMFIINFRKGRVYPFVNRPLNEFTNFVVEGELALPKEIYNLRHQLQSSLQIDQKFSVAESYFLKSFSGKLEVNPFVDFAVNSIVKSPNLLTIEQIASKVGYSQKHLIKIFKENVGFAPKSFLKIIRFQKAVQEIENLKGINWSGVALDCGYYDQAHFINEFRKFSGFTPTQYLHHKGEYLNYLPIE